MCDIYTMTKFKLESIECYESNGIFGGDFRVVMFNNQMTIVALMRVEIDDHDYDHFNITSELLEAEQYDAMDEPVAVTAPTKDIENFVNSDYEVDSFFQDRLEDLADESRMEYAISQLQEENWFLLD